jgi:hypothetical protein
MRITKTLAGAALCVVVTLTTAGCSDDKGSDTTADAAAAKSEIQAKADQRLAEIAAAPNLEPGIAGYLREVVAISLEFQVKPSKDGKNSTVNEAITDAKAARELMCISDGNGNWAPGSGFTSMRDVYVDEFAKGLKEDNQVEGDSVATVVAGRVLTAMEKHLCQGPQSAA